MKLVIRRLGGSREETTCSTSVACNAGGRVNFSCLQSGVVTCTRREIRHNRSFTVISRISSVLVSRTEAPLVVSNINSGSASLCGVTSDFTGALGGIAMGRLSSGRGTRRRLSRSNSFMISRGTGATALAGSNVTGTRTCFGLRGLVSDRGVAILRRVRRTVGTVNIVGHSISCIMGSKRILVISRFAKHVVLNHHCDRNLRRTVRTGRNIGMRERSGALTAVAFRGCFELCSGLSNVANATVARDARFRRVCSLSIVSVPAGGPVVEVSSPSILCGARRTGFGTVVSHVVRYRRGNRPILINAVDVRGDRTLSGTLGGHNVGRRMLGTGCRRGRTRVVTRTNGFKTIAVTAGVTNHNASVVLKKGPRCVTGTRVHGGNCSSRLVTRTANCTRASSRRVLRTEGAFHRLRGGRGRRLGSRTTGIEGTNNLCVVNARHRRSEQVSGRLHNHSKHRKSPNRDRFFLSTRSSLLELFTNSEFCGVLGGFGTINSVPVRTNVLSGSVRDTRGGMRTGGFTAHHGILRFSSIVGRRHGGVCDRHGRILSKTSLRRAVRGVVGSCFSDVIRFCYPSSLPRGR